ncbi:MAG: hypothetical protein V4608_10075 [Bacteroidota bacterium]
MKTVTLVLLTIILTIANNTVSGQTKAKKTTREDNYIKGIVKSVTKLTYPASSVGGVAQKGALESKRTSTYDQYGNLIEFSFNNLATKYAGKQTYQFNARNQETEYKSFDETGTVKEMKTHKYDEKGNMIEEANLKTIGVFIWKVSNTYDSKGNKTESVKNVMADNSNTKTTYLYDSNNNLTEENLFDNKGRNYKKFTYKYDGENRLLEKATYNISEEDWDGDNEIADYKDTYKYDAKGKVIEKTEGRPSVLGDDKHIYTYDASGNQIEDMKTNSPKSRKTRKYDAAGNVLELVSYNASDAVEETAIYTVNNRNENTSYTLLNADGSVKSKYIYKYEGEDKSGNWLKMSTEKDGAPLFIFEREIVHY